MEALWTRFQPISLEIKKIVNSEELGVIQAVHADLSADFNIDSKLDAKIIEQSIEDL